MSATSTAMVARPMRRRQSTPAAASRSAQICQPLPHSIDALDLTTAAALQQLASIRFLVLSYLADLEKELALLESPDWKSKSETTIEEVGQWLMTTMEMLQSIRDDVRSHLPELHLADITVENLRSHLPDLPDVPSMNDVRAHFPDMPNVRSHISDVRARLPSFDLSEMRHRLDDVRTKFHDIDFRKPLRFIPVLSDHINNLRSHLSSIDLLPGLDLPSMEPNSLLSDLVDSLLTSDIFSDLVDDDESGVNEEDDLIERAAKEVANAVKRSLDGLQLIKYTDLPENWRNNPFVAHGYRFIPIHRWERIILSLFAFHNETLNIHTHLIPCILWTINCIPWIKSSNLTDTPETLFMIFALLCLFCSSVWHTMSCCAHHATMETCARIDYVGIGWLISASVGTVVWYGLQCHPKLGNCFLVLCFLTGAAGNIFPFMAWFNAYEYRGYRILFFLALAFSSVAPMAAMAYYHSTREMLSFIAPVLPSLVSYVVGLVFYASHIPERWLPESVCRKLDVVGGGSHCIWHCFIVLAVSQHKAAIQIMKEGMQCRL